ncbi:hypothetical protein NEOLI_000090 [Neolecta irregularis DAH-3]|uniref:Uncharacterized protein n=1 Tax=Neolecta irregularis (strain DAH-3) TaxID=1198029 RepID=A0A1U7LVJ0_NEOID|nr:hypothetical protein NEOLI_000090 [Neolecta irregularis DAH-3]|eukprot:OLL26638.1 hypothetical protein NEOLI_000090 [Neolecta irregularis DAH-3]
MNRSETYRTRSNIGQSFKPEINRKPSHLTDVSKWRVDLQFSEATPDIVQTTPESLQKQEFLRKYRQASISVLMKSKRYKNAASLIRTQINRGHNDIRLWIQLLKMLGYSGNQAELFNTWKRMLRSGLHFECPDDIFWYTMWARVIVIGRRYPDFLDMLWEYAQAKMAMDNRQWDQLYDLVIGHLLQGVTARECPKTMVICWHEHLFPKVKPVSWDFLCKCASKSTASLRVFRSVYKSLKKVSHYIPSIYEPLIPILLRNRSVTQAQSWNDYLLNQNGQLSNSIVVNPLLKHHVSFSTRQKVEALFEKLLQRRIPIHSSTLDILGSFYAGRGDLDRLPKLVRIPNIIGKISQEFWCFWLSAEYRLCKKYSNTVREMILSGAEFGDKCTAVFSHNAESLSQLEYKIRGFWKKDIKPVPETYAALVRHCARKGYIGRAFLTADSSIQHFGISSWPLIARNLCIGLVQAQSYHVLENVHKTLVNENLATMDTWNLLLRSRIFHRDEIGTFSCLQQMETLGIPVENASATDLRQAILRPRKIGETISTAHPGDTRPESEDIEQAIEALIRCMKAGGRVQPEAWKEILLRIIFANDFGVLYTLSNWLIAQYRPREPGKPHRSFVTIPDALYFAGSWNKIHPLRRLFTRSFLVFVIASGFSDRCEKDVLDMLLQWKLSGVHIDIRLVSQATAGQLHLHYPELTRQNVEMRTKRLLQFWNEKIKIRIKSIFKKRRRPVARRRPRRFCNLEQKGRPKTPKMNPLLIRLS